MKFIDEKIENYAISHSSCPSSIADELEAYTREHVDMSQMLVGKLEASLLSSLIKLTKARKVLEFGTYTGYSALCMAQALPADGEVHTLDINEETVLIGKQYWDRAEVSHKIHSYIAPAAETLSSFNQSSFDLIFIDADKENYKAYFDQSLDLLAQGGLIVLDNVLWSGKVLADKPVESSSQSLKALNSYIKNREDLFATMLPIRDGIFLVQKV